MEERTSEEARATETRLERTARVIEADLARYSSRDRLTDQPLRATEEAANRYASMVNHAIGLSDNGYNYGGEPFAIGLGLTASSRPAGTETGKWYVIVGTVEETAVSPKWYLRNEGDAIEVAKALLFTIESFPDTLDALKKWSDSWMV